MVSPKQNPGLSGTGFRGIEPAGERVEREHTHTGNPTQAIATKTKGGKAPRRAGNRVERIITKGWQAAGFAAERIPLSGSAGGSFTGDISLPLLGVDRCVEVKSRRDGFREIYKFLAERDVLVVKAARAEPLVIVRMSLAIAVAKKAEGIA
jgi:Holliday junction resolvase